MSFFWVPPSTLPPETVTATLTAEELDDEAEVAGDEAEAAGDETDPDALRELVVEEELLPQASRMKVRLAASAVSRGRGIGRA